MFFRKVKWVNDKISIALLRLPWSCLHSDISIIIIIYTNKERKTWLRVTCYR